MIRYTSDKILPYIYKLTHKVTGQFYYGSRFTRKLKLPSHIDIFEYRSSSKTIKNMGFDNFNVEIIAEFFHPDDAFLIEQELIEENWSDLCLNKHYMKSGINHFSRKGTKLSNDITSKISKSLKGRSIKKNRKWTIKNTKTSQIWENCNLKDFCNMHGINYPAFKNKHRNSKDPYLDEWIYF